MCLFQEGVRCITSSQTDGSFALLTVVSLWRGVSPVVGLGHQASLPVAAVLVVVAGVVVAGLGVLFQLLGQVGARRAGGNVVFVAILRDLQLLDETHRPEMQPDYDVAAKSTFDL